MYNTRTKRKTWNIPYTTKELKRVLNNNKRSLTNTKIIKKTTCKNKSFQTNHVQLNIDEKNYSIGVNLNSSAWNAGSLMDGSVWR